MFNILLANHVMDMEGICFFYFDLNNMPAYLCWFQEKHPL